MKLSFEFSCWELPALLKNLSVDAEEYFEELKAKSMEAEDEDDDAEDEQCCCDDERSEALAEADAKVQKAFEDLFEAMRNFGDVAGKRGNNNDADRSDDRG